MVDDLLKTYIFRLYIKALGSPILRFNFFIFLTSSTSMF